MSSRVRALTLLAATVSDAGCACVACCECAFANILNHVAKTCSFSLAVADSAAAAVDGSLALIAPAALVCKASDGSAIAALAWV